MQDLITKLLEEIGEDPSREGLAKTPQRFAEMMRELTTGYAQSPEKIVNGALFPAESCNLVCVRNIDVYSLCEHHLLPFFGKVHIGYVPDENVVGLSKLPRIVEIYARRLQTQERLGTQIADALEQILHPKGIGIVLQAEHLCMKMRGVEKDNTSVRTEVFRGSLQKPEEKKAFLLALGGD